MNARAMLLALLLAACSPAPPTFTDTPATDAAWSRVLDCYAAAGHDVSRARQPDVIVRPDCRAKYASQDFIGSEGAWVFGEAHPDSGYVEVCPDLAAIEHEYSHIAHHAALGTNGAHGVGCFGVTI